MSATGPGSATSQSDGSQSLVYWLPSLSSQSTNSDSCSVASEPLSGGQGGEAHRPATVLQPVRSQRSAGSDKQGKPSPLDDQISTNVQQPLPGSARLLPAPAEPYCHAGTGVSADLSGQWPACTFDAHDLQSLPIQSTHANGEWGSLDNGAGYYNTGMYASNAYLPWQAGAVDTQGIVVLPLGEVTFPVVNHCTNAGPPQAASNRLDIKPPQQQRCAMENRQSLQAALEQKRCEMQGQRSPAAGNPQQQLQVAAEQGCVTEGQRDGDEQQAIESIGSAQHSQGLCQPCVFWFKSQCVKGSQCRYCHLFHDGQKNKRIRPSKRTREQRRGPDDELFATGQG